MTNTEHTTFGSNEEVTLTTAQVFCFSAC